ncbi:GH25 family lysozyme [Pediococcus claussenii]|nr:GH25 family lysozyme [Pediococcus claussenii]ANZ69004.1 hypothetical protein AYR57_01230 [Pediococcus claussenii]ANZ70820.1 hypothetical protein AYR58_01230 [Pediococcus claussenii]
MNSKNRSQSRPKFNQGILWRKRIVVILAVILVGTILVGGIMKYASFQKEEEARLNNYSTHGVTLNQDDGTVDFQQLQQKNVDFVYLTATTGATYLDDSFNGNYQRIQGVNVPVGVIHSFGFQKDAQKQFDFFKSKLKNNIGTLPIAINIEYYGDFNANNVRWQKQGPQVVKLIRLLANYYGQAVIIKTTPDIYKKLYKKYVRQTPFWIVTTHVGKAVKNIKLVQFDDRRYENDGEQLTLPESYFSGNKEMWRDFSN